MSTLLFLDLRKIDSLEFENEIYQTIIKGRYFYLIGCLGLF